jgi:protein O-GlcNAc transferase
MNYRKLAAQYPSQSEWHNHLGIESASASLLGDALLRFRRAASIDPQGLDAQINLGIACLELKRFPAAARPFRRTLCLLPGDADAWHGLGLSRAKAEGPALGTTAFHRALTIRPGHIETLLQLFGDQPGRARALHRCALALQPDRWTSLIDHGVALARLERQRESLASSRRASAVNPQAVQAYVNAASAHGLLGDIPMGLRQLQKAVDAAPMQSDAFRHLMSMAAYTPAVDEAMRWDLACSFGRRYAPDPPVMLRTEDPDPDRNLRVAYLSSDFGDHPVTRNMLPLLESRDRAGAHVLCYSLTPRQDEAAQRLRAAVDGWRVVTESSDEAIAHQIRSDRIDILVILAGRFDRNRPLVAAHRAAPIQISMHDVGTSGISEMDYLIADRALVAPKSRRKEQFVERVLRLPSFYVHAALPDLPVSSAPPQTRKGHVTFGCFNSPVKFSDDLLQCWRRLLETMPDARLLLKYKRRYVDPDIRSRISRSFGGASGRIVFVTEGDSQPEHLAQYEEIDVALDSHPFVGSTTTWEALWMGVPVITLPGANIATRTGLSLLRPLGLHQLVATTAEDYLSRARTLAGDIPRLTAWRQELRARLLRSPLVDGPRRARQIDRLYRAVWRRHCRNLGS